ncbi:MAG TPA: cytochrome P450 [Conexibacter sp.]|nr:cytochrome P450 [Conexibacter sp.]
MSAITPHAAAAARPTPTPAIPGPPGHPLLGMARELRGDLLGTLQRGFAEHGDVVAYRVGPAHGPQRLRPRLVAVRHPDDLRRVLLETDVFVRRAPSYDVLRELFGETLVTLEGARWQRQKRILQPLFTRRHVAHYAELLEAEANRVVAQWRELGDEPVDVAQAMEQYALRVLGQTIFAEQDGIDVDTVAALERLVPRVGDQVVARMTQLVRPPLRWPTARNQRFLALRAELRETIERVLARRDENDRDSGAGELLHQLREARDPHGGPSLTSHEVRDEALLLMIAGHTTTADVLTSTLYLLGRHPALQEQVSAAAASDAADGSDDLVRAAIQEAMRLHPPSYALARRAAVDTELGGYAVPAGALVLVVPWATHRDARFWPDPERFDPLRFVGEQPRPAFAYVPFGGGGRACIGRHLAMLESTILVRALLRSYRLESLDATLPLSPLISMRPLGPVRVRFHPRRPVGAGA